jgi:retron-type reverse transcriptase
VEPRGRLTRNVWSFNQGAALGGNEVDMPTSQAKPYDIPKPLVWEAYRRVAANKGAPGVDEVTVGEFEADLRDNLYKIWNRMSSGSYFPPPVRAVEIPKPHGGGVRVLGVPTVADRVAQTVVAMHLEQRAEPRFHPGSYGYRPGRAAWDAIEVTRRRCWEFDWVIDLDVQKFFDTVPWDLVLKAVEAVCTTPWVLLYVKRWLQAPLQHADGTVVERKMGTPQGSAVSPILANLFMHYAFDTWMVRNHPDCPFERYADDGAPRMQRRSRCRRSSHRMQCCARDGGGPSGTALQGEVPNHRKVRRSRAGVLSIADKADHQSVRCEPRRRARANHSVTRRKRIDDIRTGECRCSGMSLVETCLLTRWCPALRWRELGSGSGAERGNLPSDTGPAVHLTVWSPGRRERDPQAAETVRGRVAMRRAGADRLVVAPKPANAGGAKGAGCPGSFGGQPPQGGMSR